jgi:hypothetical protein
VNDGNVRAFIDDYLVLQIDCTHERIPASPQASCMWSSLSLSSLSSVIQLSQTFIEKPLLVPKVTYTHAENSGFTHHVSLYGFMEYEAMSSLSRVIQLSQTLIEKPPLDDHVPFLNSQHGKPSHLRSTASHAPKLPNNVAKGASIR